ncbi:SDR family oxidoreductase [Hydrocarboniclastica marina]|uniref:Short chain dehydrogenase n=1 Tax=Hydrocarboniclastica marina TaxID=2259620 RepID=A0A4V1D918_9ALTE|nr:SDR family oxidoreductase [Hydrocarboniclastica marina]QCF27140.1 short chain dehydrogenase [Hydrocarboniclastica marina]
MQLRDRVFLLLGGTGGIGQALVEPLVQAGARLIIASRTIDEKPRVIAREETPGTIMTVRLDLSADDLDHQLVGLSERFPVIDGVIHCAGSNHFASISQAPVRAIDEQIAVNLRSAIIVARHFAPRFSQRGTGALVFVGSTFGSIGFPGYTAYCATKFGLRGFSEALRRELADTGVEVMYVAPRATATAMNPEAVNAMNKALGNVMDAPEAVAGQILKAMKKGQKRRFLGWPEKLFVVLNSLLPRLVDKAMLKQLPVIRRFLDSGATQ